MNNVAALARAYHFAGTKHVDQRRKGAAAEPYVNHVLEVADLVATATEGADIDVIIAAVLHDTIEDTETTKDDLVASFGQRVADLVAEVTDDKTLPKMERKRLQIEHARHASSGAKLIKVADKTANLRALFSSPPNNWSEERIRGYVAWAGEVVAQCRGVNASLEHQFDQACLRCSDKRL